MVRSIKDSTKELCQFLSNYRPCRCDALQDHDYYSASGKLFLHQMFDFVCFHCLLKMKLNLKVL